MLDEEHGTFNPIDYRQLALSMATGSPPDAAQAAGSIEANRSAAGRCQDQRRLLTTEASGSRAAGRTVRTVNRLIALTWTTLGCLNHPGQSAPAGYMSSRRFSPRDMLLRR